MPKMKTKSASKKRFKITGTGKIKFQHAGTRHIATGKRRKNKRQLKGTRVIDKTDAERVINCLPYGGGI
jgi:large subunit ribosomal protein L35